MVSVHAYNKEKKDPGFKDTYLMVILFGAIVAVIAIIGVKGLIWLVNLFLKYWLWTLLVMAGILLIRRYLFRRKRRYEP